MPRFRKCTNRYEKVPFLTVRKRNRGHFIDLIPDRHIYYLPNEVIFRNIWRRCGYFTVTTNFTDPANFPNHGYLADYRNLTDYDSLSHSHGHERRIDSAAYLAVTLGNITYHHYTD